MMDQPANYECEMPFWIDTNAYTDRDRLMFVAGSEFTMIYDLLKSGWRGTRVLHRENESRVRMMCGRLGLKCTVRQHEGYEGCDEWSELIVEE